MTNFGIAWILTLIWTFITPLIISTCCKKRRPPPPPQNPALVMKSVKCNQNSGLGTVDPDLKSEDRNLRVKTNKKEAPPPPPHPPPPGPVKGSNKETTLVTKDQCDTDLRSFLSENQKREEKSLAPTQEPIEEKKEAPKMDDKKAAKKALGVLDCTQNDSKIHTIQEANLTQKEITADVRHDVVDDNKKPDGKSNKSAPQIAPKKTPSMLLPTSLASPASTPAVPAPQSTVAPPPAPPNPSAPAPAPAPDAADDPVAASKYMA